MSAKVLQIIQICKFLHDQIDFFDYFASFGQNGHAIFSNAVFKKMPFLRAKRWLFVRYYLDVLDTTTDSFPTYYLLTSYYDVQDGREMVAVRIYSSLLVLHYYLLTTLRFFICVYRKKAVPLQTLSEESYTPKKRYPL